MCLLFAIDGVSGCFARCEQRQIQETIDDEPMNLALQRAPCLDELSRFVEAAKEMIGCQQCRFLGELVTGEFIRGNTRK